MRPAEAFAALAWIVFCIAANLVWIAAVVYVVVLVLRAAGLT